MQTHAKAKKDREFEAANGAVETCLPWFIIVSVCKNGKTRDLNSNPTASPPNPAISIDNGAFFMIRSDTPNATDDEERDKHARIGRFG